MSGHLAASEDKVLDVVVGWAKPPYIDQENNSGFEIELIENVMNPLGYRINILYVPYGRTHGMVINDQADMMLTAHDRLGLPPNMLSDKYVVYENVAVTLKDSGIKINKIEDLSQHSLVAFQNASLVLGKRFSRAVAQNKLYTELPEQRNQVEMLFKEKTKVIVLDINIFTHFQRELSEFRQQKAYTIHHIFAENQYRVAIKDKKLRQNFNASLAKYIKSGHYDKLRKKYALAPQNLD